MWNFCDLWLQHIERHTFAGPYFFTGAFLEHVDQPGPMAEAVKAIAQEWFVTRISSFPEAVLHFITTAETAIYELSTSRCFLELIRKMRI